MIDESQKLLLEQAHDLGKKISQTGEGIHKFIGGLCTAKIRSTIHEACHWAAINYDDEVPIDFFLHNTVEYEEYPGFLSPFMWLFDIGFKKTMNEEKRDQHEEFALSSEILLLREFGILIDDDVFVTYKLQDHKNHKKTNQGKIVQSIISRSRTKDAQKEANLAKDVISSWAEKYLQPC